LFLISFSYFFFFFSPQDFVFKGIDREMRAEIAAAAAAAGAGSCAPPERTGSG